MKDFERTHLGKNEHAYFIFDIDRKFIHTFQHINIIKKYKYIKIILTIYSVHPNRSALCKCKSLGAHLISSIIKKPVGWYLQPDGRPTCIHVY